MPCHDPSEQEEEVDARVSVLGSPILRYSFDFEGLGIEVNGVRGLHDCCFHPHLGWAPCLWCVLQCRLPDMQEGELPKDCCVM